ncbi:MAG: hypothetical protein RL742_1281, partial [Bacteroidota bacterium]
MKKFLFGLLLAGALPVLLPAQTLDTILPIVPYDQIKAYEIGGIRVTGAQYADPNALIALSGF